MAELSKLGRYELRRVLGRGAMGVVYEGFDPNLSRRVAVKTILKSAALDEETERAYSARFVREAQAVGRLNHPNIVQVHDFGEQDEIAYLVMEFIEGRELRGFFGAKEAFAPPETVRIMSELLDALEFAHERGVIHRDIKPANVMLDAQRRVKLTDFGVARVQDSDRSAAGTMVGTPAFMSPEQISGGRIDRRTDIFSAGVVLYQLLTGEQPFKGEGAWTVAKQIMESDPPLPSTVVQSISPAFDAHGLDLRLDAHRPDDLPFHRAEGVGGVRGKREGDPVRPAEPGLEREIPLEGPPLVVEGRFLPPLLRREPSRGADPRRESAELPRPPRLEHELGLDGMTGSDAVVHEAEVEGPERMSFETVGEPERGAKEVQDDGHADDEEKPARRTSLIESGEVGEDEGEERRDEERHP